MVGVTCILDPVLQCNLFLPLVGIAEHYENTPMQYTAIFHGCKNDNFQLNFIFTIFIFLLKTYIVGTR